MSIKSLFSKIFNCLLYWLGVLFYVSEDKDKKELGELLLLRQYLKELENDNEENQAERYNKKYGKIIPKYCQNCGGEIKPWYRYCPYCRYKLN